MKTILRLTVVVSLLALVAVGLFAQQAQLTRVVTIAGDSTTKVITRGTIEYLPNGVIWIAGGEYPYATIGKNVAYRSTDHGATWTKSTLYTNSTLSSPGVTGIAAKDANTAMVCTSTGEILRTTNGGTKWDTVSFYSPPDGFCNGIKFVSGDTVVAYGDADGSGLYVARSFDAGKTWTRVPNTNANLPGDSLNAAGAGVFAGYATYGQAMDVYGRTIWMTLYNVTNDPPSILKSTDAGNTWSWFRVTLPSGAAQNYYFRSISFKDNNVGYAVGRRAYGTTSSFDNYLCKTTDGGRTWSDTISVEPGKSHTDAKPMVVKAIRGTNTVLAVGYGTSGSKSWISTDNGATWAVINTPSPSTSSDLRNFSFADDKRGYAIGYYNMAKIQLRDAVNVTFLANTATVPDTLKPNSFIQIRGSVDAFGPWGLSSTAILSNVAGDYWKATVKLAVGDTIQYKFFTNANKAPIPSSAEHQGWEQNTTDGSGNRILIVGSKDTTLPLQFVNGTPSNQPQYFKPYVDKTDSIEVWFRVNMSGQESFNKATQFMGVRGGFSGTDYKDWAKSVVLTREDQHGNGGSRQYDGTNFWSGYVRVPKSTFTSNIEYKFVIMKTASPTSDIIAWEDGIKPAPDVAGGGNRVISASPGISDTTLYWKWWANNPFVPFVGQDTITVTFRANLSRAVAERGFAFGDTLQVRTGYGGTAKEVKTTTMTRSGLTGTIFTATETIIAAVGKPVNYQYYLVKGGNDVREVFYDFDDASGGSQAERRKMTPATKTVTLNDTTSTQTDMRRMPRFRNTAKLTKNVAVTYTVDVRPAYYTIKGGKKLVSTNITPYTIGNADSVFKWGVWMNGPAVGGWDVRGGWGAARRADTLSKMYDDGTHGDVVKGDSIYSLVWNYTTSDFFGQEFKFGIGGFDNEGGFGNNHIENVDDAAATYTIASQFGSIDPKFFNAWNFDLKKPQTPTAVEDYQVVPMVYNLSQNYPNPFNPTTTIQFNLPIESNVTLKVFNVLGQELMTIVSEKMKAGNHLVKFDASKLSSGIYLYQINAGKFTETKKMVLLK